VIFQRQRAAEKRRAPGARAEAISYLTNLGLDPSFRIAGGNWTDYFEEKYYHALK
jgi:hypothetical protein